MIIRIILVLIITLFFLGCGLKLKYNESDFIVKYETKNN